MITSRPGVVFGGLSLLFILAFTGTAFAGFAGFVKNGNGNDYPAESNGRKSAPPVANAHYLDGDVINLDGKLDESVWERAPGATGFYMWDPERGELPSEETVFKVLYDSDAIYFGVACFENDPNKISQNLSRRDRFSNSDLVSIYIDPYHDKTTGYNFKVNPLGVQIDAYIFNDGDQDQDWDAVWEAETYHDEHGWYTEIRIPFSSIRYRPSDDMTWGLQVYRYMHGRGEDTAWTTWDRETRGFVSRFGTLQGLENIKAPRQLEITPYFVARAVDPSAAAEDEIDNVNNFGADIKYGVTADLTLNATIQPDFGQVEADPAVVNLSPFEVFFDERRPFFVEGARFFQHPDFNMFYSRRIGTGNEFSRIRFAGKLTGKMKGGVSVAGVFATTDVTQPGQSHNFFKVGEQKSYYGVARLGKEFNDAAYKFNIMGTGVVNTADRDTHGDFASRNAYTGALDFDLNFHNRDYNIQGSAVGAVVDHEASLTDPDITGGKQYGTGGSLDIRRLGGNTRGGIYGRWESDRLDINDLGFLSAPDEINTGGWASYSYNPDGSSKLFNRASVNFNVWKSWLYGARSGYDINTGDQVWSYNRGHRQNSGTNFNGWMQYTNYYETNWGIELMPEASLRYETRGGPLMTEPTTYGGWLGASTDYRKKLSLGLNFNHFRDVVDNHSTNFSLGPRWNQSAAINHEVRFGFSYREDDTQWLTNVELEQGSMAQGIGGVSYVFGEIRQRTFDLTWRSNILFSRKSSLELYFQPYISVGNYVNARELATADSYDLIPYADPDFRAEDFDFEFTSFNLNAVYRWEYRPGSTIYLVWTHSTQGYDERGNHENPSDFNNRPAMSGVFAHEPTNTFQMKVSYWLPI